MFQPGMRSDPEHGGAFFSVRVYSYRAGFWQSVNFFFLFFAQACDDTLSCLRKSISERALPSFCTVPLQRFLDYR